ncbi:MAG: hypothetical protein LBL65_02660 [Campylobacteraceae bacterium]|jgi:hypothetical protein|nr:hypothetical protein [Campylobacteraceae bacterium]
MNTQNTENKPDIYKINLKKESQILLECQKKRNLNSCFECENLIGCNNRKSYVRAVYDSMSQGESGGFEF